MGTGRAESHPQHRRITTGSYGPEFEPGGGEESKLSGWGSVAYTLYLSGLWPEYRICRMQWYTNVQANEWRKVTWMRDDRTWANHKGKKIEQLSKVPVIRILIQFYLYRNLNNGTLSESRFTEVYKFLQTYKCILVLIWAEGHLKERVPKMLARPCRISKASQDRWKQY